MTIQEVVAVIDRSGSMRGKENDTVGGINAMLDELKSSKTDEDIIRVSIKLFDNEQLLNKRCVDISEIGEFLLSEFIPRGSTALLDAIGDTLRFFMEKKLREPTAYDTCLVYIATDGLENASTRHTRDVIKDLISNAETTYNIKVVYLGANQDAILEAENIGISPNSAINYAENTENVEAVYRSAAAVAHRDRSGLHVMPSFTAMERQASHPNSSQHSSPPNLERQTNAVLPHPLAQTFMHQPNPTSPPPLVQQTSSA